MTRALPVLDTTRYRKVVLAAIDARGGPEHSDPFEMYDVPLDGAESLDDGEVAARVDAVWAFWCKQCDHPKYRGTITAMLALHPRIAGPMCERAGRAEFAHRAREVRAHRDAERFADLDAAVARLVDRFGGVPADKLEGLRRLGADRGLTPAEVDARIRRHRLLGEPSPPSSMPLPVLPEEVYRQVVADLAELARLDGRDGYAGLHGVLGLAPEAPREQVRRARDELAVVNRSRRPDRRRALVDDLLAAAGALLVQGDPDRYLDRLAVDVTAALRREVAAAVLVEDVLTDAARDALIASARAHGLDRARAADVVLALAGDIAPSPSPSPSPHGLVDDLRLRPLGRRVRVVFTPRADTRIHRLATDVDPPPPGTRLADRADLGATPVPAMGPGLAVDRRPGAGVTHYVAVTAGRCGAAVAFVGLAPVTDLHREGGRMRWTWPRGCTEVVVASRPDGPPESADDPAASHRKITNSRYEIEDGVPVDGRAHATVFTCARVGGRLLVATVGASAPPSSG